MNLRMLPPPDIVSAPPLIWVWIRLWLNIITHEMLNYKSITLFTLNRVACLIACLGIPWKFAPVIYTDRDAMKIEARNRNYEVETVSLLHTKISGHMDHIPGRFDKGEIPDS